MQTIFIMVKCELGKAYDVADDACGVEQDIWIVDGAGVGVRFIPDTARADGLRRDYIPGNIEAEHGANSVHQVQNVIELAVRTALDDKTDPVGVARDPTDVELDRKIGSICRGC